MGARELPECREILFHVRKLIKSLRSCIAFKGHKFYAYFDIELKCCNQTPESRGQCVLCASPCAAS